MLRNLLLPLLCAGVSFAQLPPKISPGGIVNAADYSASLAPGSVVVIYGTDLAPKLSQASSMPLPASLEGTSVEVVDGARTLGAPLYWVSSTAVSAQLPFELAGSTPQVRVKTTAGTSATVSVRVSPVAPRLFTKTMNGLGEPLVYHSNYALVSADSPAQPGEAVFLYMTGLGAVSPAVATGARAGDGATLGPLNLVQAPVKVAVGGADAPLLWAGLMPGFVGVYQVNFKIPDAVVAGDYPIEVAVGDQKSQSQVALFAGDKPLKLIDIWNTAACSLVDASTFTLLEDDYAASLQVWYRFASGESAVAYTLSRNGQTVRSGSLQKQACDTTQAAWCVARDLIRGRLPAGDYQVKLARPQMCANTASNGQGFLQLFGVSADGAWRTLQVSSIGQSGGTVAGPGISIQVPAGAFSQPADLRLAALQNQSPAAGGVVSGFYRLDGLPQQAAPITITLDPVTAVPDGEVFLAMKAIGDVTGGPVLFPAQVKDGKLVATLTGSPTGPPPAALASRKSENAAGVAESAKASWMLWTLAGLTASSSSAKHFIIHIPSSYATVQTQVDQGLEKAYSLIDGMGMKWSRRGTQPIEVYVFPYSSWWSVLIGGKGVANGNEETEFWSKDNIGLCINLDLIASGSASALEETRITVGHELLHIMQSQYDPREYFVTFRYSRWYWMDEASAVWFERALATDPNYISGLMKGQQDYLLKGGLEQTVTLGAFGTDAVKDHGYGAASFLEHLAPASPGIASTKIGDVLRLMAVESNIGFTKSSLYSATEALGSVFPDLPQQWVAYSKKWVERTLYPAQPDVPGFTQVVNAWPASVTFDADSEVLRYTGADLSAALYKVSFPSSLNWKDGTKLKFELAGPSGGAVALLWELTGTTLTFYKSIDTTYEEPSAEKWMKAGTSLVVMLVNKHFAQPYTSLNEIKLTLTAGSVYGFTCLTFGGYNGSLEFPTIETTLHPPQVIANTQRIQVRNCNVMSYLTPPTVPIVWSGPNFSGSGLLILDQPGKSHGTINLSFEGTLVDDPSRVSTSPGTSFKFVEGLHIVYEYHFSSDSYAPGANGTLGEDGRFELRMKRFPVQIDTWLLYWQGADAAPYVDTLTYKTSRNNYEGKLDMTWAYDPARPIKSYINFQMQK